MKNCKNPNCLMPLEEEWKCCPYCTVEQTLIPSFVADYDVEVNSSSTVIASSSTGTPGVLKSERFSLSQSHHSVGTQLLCTLWRGQKRKYGLREADGKWPGQRFGIVLTGSGVDFGRLVAEAIRELSFHGLIVLDHDGYFLTSFGLDYCSQLDCRNVPSLVPIGD